VRELSRLATLWYRAHRRSLPWRGAGPWGVFVSEVMLQQTPVARVLPVYERWMARWPEPARQAEAAPADVLTAWGGLGYPRRARRLHASAAVMVEQHGGRVPHRLDDLLALPGVGPYTARAVAAFGFGQRHAVVDTNVRRVVARVVDGVDHPPPRADVVRVEALLPPEPPAAVEASAALMELGALVCRARPRCDVCPVAGLCRWRAAGRPATQRAPARPRFEGSDRQARGRLLAVLRSGADIDAAAAAEAVPDAARRRRALRGLVADGLVVADGPVWRFPHPGE
jgi:A/G-specific adenine glycosylase